MKIIEDTITLGDKTYKATEIDFDEYYKEEGQITAGNEIKKATEVIGIEDTSE